MLTDRKIREALPGLSLFTQASMSAYTSFHIGGPADLLAMPRDAEELKALLQLSARHETPVLCMGNGTNLLVSDAGVRGLVIKTHPGFAQVVRRGDRDIEADAGALLSRVASKAAEWGLSGMAFAHGIPGTVGGALAMNAGAYGGEMSQVVLEAQGVGFDSASFFLTHAQLDFSYRNSFFGQNPEIMATSAVFRLTPDDPESIRRDMAALSGKRRASQPLEYPSAGSVFKRPPGAYAAALIDDCGLKGYAVGGAQVSEKHAGFIVNRGGATCEQVKRLIEYIQETVLTQTGVTLTCELKIVGESL